MSGWRKCDTCRKVRPVEEFDEGSPTCRTCASSPARRRGNPVAVARSPASAAGRAVVRRVGAVGPVGMGDLEVRERRAKRAAWEALAAAHPEQFAALLAEARGAEGLPRPAAPPSGSGTRDVAGGHS